MNQAEAYEGNSLVHDIILALSFLVIITAPAFIVMRVDRGQHDL